MSSNYNVSPSPSSSDVAVATVSTLPRSIVALETAARDTINQAMVVWKDQRMPKPGSVHTVQTERTRDGSILNQSGVMVVNDKSQRGTRSSTALGQTVDQPVLIAVCGMTGSGKSNFISKLAGRDVGIGNGLRSRELDMKTLHCAPLTVSLRLQRPTP
jgi:ABC-type transport system involved in cytochrome bd biosynthesis fused ATPase/permease subunit